VKASQKIECLLVVFLLFSVGDLSAASNLGSFGGSGEEKVAQASPPRFSVSGKILYHTFWKQGLLDNGDAYGRPGLGTSDLAGFGGEFDFDYHWKPFAVFTATLGAYQGSTGEHKIDIVTAYFLATAKLQKSGRIADYYVGAGVGGYFSQIDADGTAHALKPGVHGLIGIKVHVTQRWSVFLEDRLAITMRAGGGFGDLDLGGNFLLLGGSYRFQKF
jgi:hypothetical protein